jgi:internalin A
MSEGRPQPLDPPEPAPDEGLLLTGPVPLAAFAAATADARGVRVEWALFDNRARGYSYRVLRCSKGPLSRVDFERVVSRFVSGAEDSLPQYTVGWIPDGSGGPEYLAVGIHELADADPARSGGRVRALQSRKIEYIRLFCVRYADLASHRATYYELVDAVKDTQLPADLTEPLRMGLPHFDPPRLVPAVREFAESVSALLLTTRPVYILGAEGIPAVDRLRFIDYVMSLLPYGLRATFYASTWDSATARERGLRLFFTNARGASDDGTCLHWLQPVGPEVTAADLPVRHYSKWLKLGGTEALPELADQTEPVRFTADDVRKVIAELPSDRPVKDVLEGLADGLRRWDQPVVAAAVKRLRNQWRTSPPDAAGRLWFRQEAGRLGLVRPHPGLHPRTAASVYRVLLNLAFENPMTYTGYCDLLDCAGGPPSGALRQEVLDPDRKFASYIPWLLAWSSEGEFSDQNLRDNLREQGIAAADPLREVQRDIGRVRKEHRAAVYDFAVNYLRVASPHPRAELRRLGYLTSTVDAAFPGDLRTQRIRLEDTLRFAYDGLLSDAQVREIYAQPGLTATPAFNAAVERLRRPPEEGRKPGRRGPLVPAAVIRGGQVMLAADAVDRVRDGQLRGRWGLTADLAVSSYEAVSGAVLPLVISAAAKCARCTGEAGRACRECGGTGSAQVLRREATVRIPPGVREREVLVYSGLGQQDRDGSAGDLFLRLAVQQQVRIAEGKVVLVGEGTVGKTSLMAALRGDQFCDQARTHGIEVHSLEVSGPRSGASMTLRCWDFGGQQVYQPTHQFFFSPEALYLVVWNSRAGQRKDDVAGWMNRVRQRVGDNAKVMLVATHSDEVEPDLDYAELCRRFPGLLCGHHEVDNKTGRGITQLRAAIVRQSAALHGEQVLPGAWVNAMSAILARAAAEPQISYDDFAASCGVYGLTRQEAAKLAELLHTLGRIVYHGTDEALSDLVILNPEWLSKAIGRVLEDGPARQDGGILDHSRLPLIWRAGEGEPAYKRAHFPYFLQLMEKFDLSYRLEGGRRSLIAELVPAGRPSLPWDRPTPLPEGIHRLVLVFSLAESVPGLVSALTVRLSYADIGLHWRTGVFLRHPNPAYASEALVELSGTELRLEVRAPFPDYFLHVLQESVEHLAERWPWLDCKSSASLPCPASFTEDCDGQFPLRNLLLLRHKQQAEVMCTRCTGFYEIAELLTGIVGPPRSVSVHPVDMTADELRDIIAAGIRPLDRSIRELQAAAAGNADTLRRLLALASTEINCPRLFTLVSVSPKGLQKLKPHERQYRLTLWCEHPDQPHPCGDGTYHFVQSADWVRKVSKYARPILALLRTAAPLAGALADILPAREQLNSASSELEHMQALLDEFPEFPEDGPDWSAAESKQPTAASGHYLREVRHLLGQIDGFETYGGLDRVQTRTGELLWVCPRHSTAYNPGLPDI